MTDKQTQYLTGSNHGEVAQKVTDLLSRYGVTQDLLVSVRDALIVHLRKYDVGVKYIDTIRDEDPGSDHAETATCDDGQTIILLSDMTKHGGIVTQLYDIMHLGGGHLLQWGMRTDPGDRLFRGDKAFYIGESFHTREKYPDLSDDEYDQLIDMVELYEREGGQMGLRNLHQAMQDVGLSEEGRQAIAKLYNDYQQNDGDFLLEYYRTGTSKNFFDQWRYDRDILELLSVPDGLKAQYRPPLQIGVIRTTEAENNL